MPRKLSFAEEKQKHNMYLSNLQKAQFYQKLQSLGLHSLAGSAAIRALINMFVEGELDNTNIVDRILQEIIITPQGKKSRM